MGDTLIDICGLARYLGRAVQTIRNDMCHAPWRVPPYVRIGRQVRWRTQVVDEWVRAQQVCDRRGSMGGRPLPTAGQVPPRRRGRPRKAEQVAWHKAWSEEAHK